MDQFPCADPASAARTSSAGEDAVASPRSIAHRFWTCLLDYQAGIVRACESTWWWWGLQTAELKVGMTSVHIIPREHNRQTTSIAGVFFGMFQDLFSAGAGGFAMF